MEEDIKGLSDEDPIRRLVEKQSDQDELSPMDPPDAYAPPKKEQLPYEEMHPFLQKLMDEHKRCIKELEAFEEVLLKIQEGGMKSSYNKALSDFFSFLDNNVVTHNLKEEKLLFPLLHEKLLETGQSSNGPNATTAVDMLEDDHIKLMQLSAVTFNFLGLVGRLPDLNSRAVVLDAALEQGKTLVEILKLHIFREDNIVFAQAQNDLSTASLDKMFAQLDKFPS